MYIVRTADATIVRAADATIVAHNSLAHPQSPSSVCISRTIKPQLPHLMRSSGHASARLCLRQVELHRSVVLVLLAGKSASSETVSSFSSYLVKEFYVRRGS